MIASHSKQEDTQFLSELLSTVEHCANKYLETEDDGWKERLISWNSILEIHKKQMEQTDYKKVDAMWERLLT